VAVCCLRSDHPRIGERLSLAQYAAEAHLPIAFLQRTGAQRSAIDQALQALGLPARRSSTVHSWNLCAELLARTDHLVSTSPEQAAILLQAAPGLRCLPLPKDLCWPRVAVQMIWHQRTHQSKPHRWLRQRLRDHAASS
jgi:LysR family nod box-dependent transcriptional activator